jgi:hypothetical protein
LVDELPTLIAAEVGVSDGVAETGGPTSAVAVGEADASLSEAFRVHAVEAAQISRNKQGNLLIDL